MPLGTYDPKRTSVIIGGAIITGFADGTFINAERTNNTWEDITGADGFTTRVKQNDTSGTITLTLQQSSPSNDVLQILHDSDEESGLATFPVTVKDILGTSQVTSTAAWIQKPANIVFSKGVESREWLIRCADLDLKNGSAPIVGL
jgi:hypothetical protein